LPALRSQDPEFLKQHASSALSFIIFCGGDGGYSYFLYFLYSAEEQDLLEILDQKLFGVRILNLILIESFLETEVLLDSCLL
jgi:hypothetical protein